MAGVKGRSGPRVQSKTRLDSILSQADTVVWRALKNPEIPELERAKLAAQFSLKKLAEKSESVVVNLNLSDELMRRIMARLELSDTNSVSLPPPPDVYVIPTIDAIDSDPTNV